MSRLTCEVIIYVEGPILTEGIKVPTYGIDSAFLRNQHGQPILPATLITGTLREILELMAEANNKKLDSQKINTWFGPRYREGEKQPNAYEPERGALRFSDFILKKETGGTHETTSTILTRIEIEDKRGSVRHGGLQVIETPLALGEKGKFVGRLVAPKNIAKEARRWINQALKFLPALGSNKGVGFGHVLDGSCISEPTPIIPQRYKESNPAPGHIEKHGVLRQVIAIRPGTPFLTGVQTVEGNLFKGSTDIPGAAIKGAIADELRRQRESGNDHAEPILEILDRLTIRHARPVHKRHDEADDIFRLRPRSLPLSLFVTQGDDDPLVTPPLLDALEHNPEEAICADGTIKKTVAFRMDWKDEKLKSHAAKCYRHTFKPVYDIRTRTAVGANQTAQTGHLFTYMAVQPGDHIWVSEILCPEDDEAAFVKLLNILANSELEIGKTKTPVHVQYYAGPPRDILAASVNLKEHCRKWRLVLESDALLHGPTIMKDEQFSSEPGERLKQHYIHYFAEALNIGPEDIIKFHYFAQQRWIGAYQAQRFSFKKESYDIYQPQLVTVAGSVFELTIQSANKAGVDTLQNCFEKFALFGLPLPRDVNPNNPCEYKRSAFNRENGYGEVTIETRSLSDISSKTKEAIEHGKQ